MSMIRSMVLVSSDPESNRLGAEQLFQRLQDEIRAFGLEDEISLSTLTDVDRKDVVPLVMVYPEVWSMARSNPRTPTTWWKSTFTKGAWPKICWLRRAS